MSPTLLRFLFRRHGVSCLLCVLPPVLIGSFMGLLWPTLNERSEALRGFVPFFERIFGDGLLDIFSARGFFSTIPFSHPMTLASFALVAARDLFQRRYLHRPGEG